MAGHSKWANIQHRKGAQDKKRGKLFTKLIREITVAAKMGGGDPDANPRLRLAIDKAKAQSMPKDNIERAVKRGAGELDGADFQEMRYEGYGPGGTAVMVDCLTDNRNRTVAEVRHAFAKFGGNLGADGSVNTVAVGAVMAAYNWDPLNHRYDKVARFVNRFFDSFDEFTDAAALWDVDFRQLASGPLEADPSRFGPGPPAIGR